MSDLPSRNRVIYQSEALFISPDCTGHHIFYLPPVAAKDETTKANCYVSGKYDTDKTIVFDACNGLVLTGEASDLKKKADFKFKTFACSGTGAYDAGNVILDAAGFESIDEESKTSKGMEYLDVSQHQGNKSPWGTAVEQIKRVQSANYSFTINRQDVNQFGHLGRLDTIALEAPTVSLDFSYYLTDGENERLLGFNTYRKYQMLSGHMSRSQNEFGNNYFILTVPEGRDAVLGDQLADEHNKSVISLGNSYVTDYSIEASVGSFPTASVTVEGMNIKSDIGTNFKSIPAIDPLDGTSFCEQCFFLPPAITGEGSSILKPGDVTIDLKDAALISKQISGLQAGYQNDDKGSAHIQSISISTPMGRTPLQRLGNTYSYAKEMDFPVTATVTVNALVADIKNSNLVNILCGTEHDLIVKIKPPECPTTCEPNAKADAIQIDIRKAVLESESFSSSIGDNKSVDLTFTTQVGGPEQQEVGVFFSGIENQVGTDSKYKEPPMIYSGYFYPFGVEGTVGQPSKGTLEGWRDDQKIRAKENTLT
jgi:hypothetical protein